MKNNNHIQTLSKLRNFICHHSDFSNALNAIEECMQMSVMNNQATGCVLVGNGGVGKSTIGKLLKNRYKSHKLIENNMEKLIVPAFYFPIPSPITIKSLAIRMLEELGCIDNNEVGTLQPFLKQTSLYLLKNFNINFDPTLTSNDILKRIFLATSGYQAYVMQLIYHSCLNALESNRLVVQMSDFHAAYTFKSIIYKPMTKKEVFKIHPNSISEILLQL